MIPSAQFLLVYLLINSCVNSSGGKTPVPTDAGNKEIPPQGQSNITAWLANEYFLDWNCEAEHHAPSEASGHGPNRTCNNDILKASQADDVFALDSASVKELYGDGDDIIGHAVALKIEEESGADSWYWYEIAKEKVAADAAGDTTCTVCHSGAEKDFVFTVVD